MSKTNTGNPELYYNRELSWLLFNRRVLGEACDKTNPLLERLKFLSITASNLDEFFMIRVASLKDMDNAGYKGTDISGMTPREQLKKVNSEAHELVNEQYEVYHRLVADLAAEGITLLESYDRLTRKQTEFLDNYFNDNVYPVLTPMAVDSSRPFPLIRNKSLNIGALVQAKKYKEREKSDSSYEFATVQVPAGLPRLVEIPGDKDGGHTYILLESIIENNLDKLFLNYNIAATCEFRIMRNADLAIDEEDAADLLIEIEKQIKKRKWGKAIRLEIKDGTDERLKEILKKELSIRKEEIYLVKGAIDLSFLMKLSAIPEGDRLRAPGHKPASVPEFPEGCNVFDVIKEGDVLMHHPYQSFRPVVDFVEAASVDPKVLAIKQTLYRVSGNSPIVSALIRAAENGKQVTVLVELKARFDEENNIVWARKLEKAGAHVIYGLVGLKTHSKITLVVRLEDEGICRYVHLGTGNYNDQTAKLYTDIGLFTCKESYGEDATAVFNMLSGYSEPAWWNKLSLAPLWLKDRFLYLIRRERDNVLAGYGGRIIAKMNSLCDKEIIDALYEASTAGVKIDLIIRGICCLKTGIPGISENITVHSIVGNFLEHGRIFYFNNNNNPEYYCGSADWMPRNLIKRVEIMFPVESPELKDRLYNILDKQLKDNVKAHILTSDGSYRKFPNEKKLDSQTYFVNEAEKLAREKLTRDNDVFHTRRFVPTSHTEEE